MVLRLLPPPPFFAFSAVPLHATTACLPLPPCLLPLRSVILPCHFPTTPATIPTTFVYLLHYTTQHGLPHLPHPGICRTCHVRLVQLYIWLVRSLRTWFCHFTTCLPRYLHFTTSFDGGALVTPPPLRVLPATPATVRCHTLCGWLEADATCHCWTTHLYVLVVYYRLIYRQFTTRITTCTHVYYWIITTVLFDYTTYLRRRGVTYALVRLLLTVILLALGPALCLLRTVLLPSSTACRAATALPALLPTTTAHHYRFARRFCLPASPVRYLPLPLPHTMPPSCTRILCRAGAAPRTGVKPRLRRSSARAFLHGSDFSPASYWEELRISVPSFYLPCTTGCCCLIFVVLSYAAASLVGSGSFAFTYRIPLVLSR